jgi:peptidoglycan/LPS O-acetylase OafA/YrhL
MTYRPDIDGLRALAVAAVILYHYGVPGLSGGYVGVDVFFVVSGYLMMSLVHGELLAGTFSLARFYERRIRRIFPALFVVLLATLACGFVILFPRPFATLAKTAIAAALFMANAAFWWRTGYFAQTAERMPLLHTWSLSLEEQFYLCFPVLMIVTARKLAGRYAAVLWVLAAASFAVSLWCTAFAPRAAFYLLPSRLWELLAGAIVALHVRGTAPRPGRDAPLAIAGLALIAGAASRFTMVTPFPGAAALLPCAGAAMILGSGAPAPTVVHRALGWAPLAAMGKISYSLFLWHWPIAVLARQALARPLTPAEAAGLIALCIVLSALSWRYIEQPFRRPGGVLRRRPLAIASGAAIAATAALAGVVIASGGVPARFSRDTLAILAWETPVPACPRRSVPNDDLGPMCTIGSPDAGMLSFVLWGDSHAGALAPAVERAAVKYGLAGQFSWLGDCPPLLGLERARWSDRSCQNRNDAMVRYLRANNIRTVILDARWASGLEIIGEAGGRSYLSWQYDEASRERSLDENRRVFQRSLARTLEVLRAGGHDVMVVGPVPESVEPVPEMLARRQLQRRSADPGPTLAAFEGKNRLVLDAFRSGPDAAEYVFPHRLLCADGEHCAIVRDGQPLYTDRAHLSRFGAESLSVLFEPRFKSIAATGSRDHD